MIPSKRLRNKIAGFVTHLMVRIASGQSVRGISLQLQEEERERQDRKIPKVSFMEKKERDFTNQRPHQEETIALLEAMDRVHLVPEKQEPGTAYRAAYRKFN
eukprot:TRINITY_DN2346_c0_g1_i1.p1 TRINITY_DN2346_c0_g1~~TRINITY_DN2346_c0_g1_i1.p1  ORF type:complete len:102 (+),score=31.41 TRINITY_DN2346_c0_g1_i1:540-845(+)